MTITQTVDIPASHRLTIDVPREVPEGPVILMFTLPPERKTPAQKPDATPENRRSWRDLYGCCAEQEDGSSYRWLRGCCKGQGSVEKFLAECHADKERELAIERRQEEERKKYAQLSS